MCAQNPSFKPEESRSFSAIHCDDWDCEMGSCIHSSNLCSYARHYAEQSFSSGFLARDYVRYGESSSGYLTRPLVFGCETSESGGLYSQHADGIMGLGRGSLSVVDQLIVQGAIASTFSLCYGGMDEDGGAMILGAVPPLEEMVFTPSNPNRRYWCHINLLLPYVSYCVPMKLVFTAVFCVITWVLRRQLLLQRCFGGDLG